MLAFIPFIFCAIGCVMCAFKIKSDSDTIRKEFNRINSTIKNEEKRAIALVELQDSLSDDGFYYVLGFGLFTCGTVYFGAELFKHFC